MAENELKKATGQERRRHSLGPCVIVLKCDLLVCNSAEQLHRQPIAWWNRFRGPGSFFGTAFQRRRAKRLPSSADLAMRLAYSRRFLAADVHFRPSEEVFPDHAQRRQVGEAALGELCRNGKAI